MSLPEAPIRKTMAVTIGFGNEVEVVMKVIAGVNRGDSRSCRGSDFTGGWEAEQKYTDWRRLASQKW